MRAAAIEARLSGHTTLPPATQLVSIKDEHFDNGSDGSEGDLYNVEVPVKLEPDDIDDPHLTADARRKEMEDGMDADERRGLREDWDAFLKTLRGKRPASPDPISSGKKARADAPGNKLALGQTMVRQETLLGLGMAPTSLGGTTRSPGTEPPAGRPSAGSSTDDGRWSCSLCTYDNIADHGRCGRSQSQRSATASS